MQGRGWAWVSWGYWFVGAVCPCGYNLLTFDFVRLIVGYVATREAEVEAEEADEEAGEVDTECNVRDGGDSFA